MDGTNPKKGELTVKPTLVLSARGVILFLAVSLTLAAAAGAEVPEVNAAPVATAEEFFLNLAALEPIQTPAFSPAEAQQKANPPTQGFPNCATCYGSWYNEPVCRLCLANRNSCNSFCGGASQVAIFTCGVYNVHCECADGRWSQCDCYFC